MHYEDIDIEQLITIAVMAGEEIMKIYALDFEVEIKNDKTPVTEADKRANAFILDALKKTYPDIPAISEETTISPYAERKSWKRCWLIDPLDGTKEFVKRNGEFTVNIALIEDGAPVIGVVHAPAQNKTYVGVKGQGSFKVVTDGGSREPQFARISNGIHYTNKRKVIIVASRSHLTKKTSAFVEQLRNSGKEIEFISSGSSLKFCLVAEGKADIYPRFSPTSEWDTAAAHAVALYAGKQVINFETRQPLTYNKENLSNPDFIVE